MPDKKPRVTVDLEPDEYRYLVQLKNDKDRSLSWLGRRAICEYIEKHHTSSQGTSQPFMTEKAQMEGRAK